MTDELEYAIISFLIFLYFTCVFEALDALSGGRIRKIEEKDERLAARLETWLDNADMYRAVLKLLLYSSAGATGIFSFRLLLSIWPDFSRSWGFLITVAFIMLSGIASELFARLTLPRIDIAILRFSMPLVSFLCRTVFFPLTHVLGRVSNAACDWHKNDSESSGASVEDEILSYVDNYDEDIDNDLEEDEKRMIRGILEIGDMSVHEIMTPRVDLVAIASNASIDDAKKMFIESGHSRIPIFGRSIDEIHGVIFAKDFIDESGLEGRTLSSLAHKAVFIPETKPVSELLEEIKRSHNHIAVIIDEYGGTSGIVTFEDIIEEIIGEVHDEYDTAADFKTTPQLMPDGSIVMEARTLVSDVNEIADTDIPDDDSADTIGGYICARLGRIPEIGEVWEMPGKIRTTVIDADSRKIKTVKIELLDGGDNE